MNGDPAIFFYHGCDWSDLPARQHYLMEAMAEHLPVVFFDGSARPGFTVKIERPQTNLTVVRGLMATCAKLIRRKMTAPASAFVNWHLRKIRRQHGKVILWCAENWLRPHRFLRHDALIYDCIDPCFHPTRQAIFDQRELTLAREATLVFATAVPLLERMRQVNRNSFLLPNGCSEREYDPEALKLLPRPRALQERTGPIIGYMGTFDWRIDIPTLIESARRLPQYTFALVGRVNPDQAESVEPLRSLPNVVLPGSVSVEEGRAYVAAFDVGLIPFLPGDIGDAINPVKMHMYLMAGKPVVTTWLRECRRYEPWVSATQSPEQFAAAIHQAVEKPAATAAARTEFARGNSWTARAAQAAAILRKQGLLQQPIEKEVLA